MAKGGGWLVLESGWLLSLGLLWLVDVSDGAMGGGHVGSGGHPL
jgi:hypothetical protein